MAIDDDKDRKGFAGLSDMVSEINDIGVPIALTQKIEAAPSAPKQQPNQQRIDNSESKEGNPRSHQPVETMIFDERGGRSRVKGIVGIASVVFVVVLCLFYFDKGPNKSSYIPPASPQDRSSQAVPTTSPLQPASETQDTGLQYTTPSIGTNNVLSVAEIRWCIRENIRIEAMRNIADTNAVIDKFNRIVDDYNSRCGSYRYRSGAQSRAERDVEPYRSQIVTAAIKEAQHLKSLEVQKSTPKSSSVLPQYSLDKQQPSPPQGKLSRAKGASVPVFNISDLDCQKSPVLCKDQAKIPVSGIVLTYDKNSLKKASTFLNGVQHGPTVSFHQNGWINWMMVFKNGHTDGPALQFYETPTGENGLIKWIIPFSNGQAEGIRRGYYETGELLSETNYSRGKESGFSYEFYKNGSLKSTEEYTAGKRVGEKKSLPPNAELKEHAPLSPSEIAAIDSVEQQSLELLNLLFTDSASATIVK